MRTDTVTPRPAVEIDRALARAVLARFLARALGPPETPVTGPTALEASDDALEAAARVLEESPGGTLTAAVDELIKGDPPESPAAAHARLFGHTLRGSVCPYESEYGQRALLQQAHELADLAGFYAAFGLKPSGHRRERPDHVACELEFLEFLSRKEAYALEACDAEMLEVTRLAIEKFLRERLGRFGRAFAVSLQTADEGGYYGRLGTLCEAFVAGGCEEFGVPAGPAMLELRPTEDDGVPMACGTDEDLVQIGAPAESAPLEIKD